MVMGSDINVAYAGTTWSKMSVTLTVPVTDACYAFSTNNVCCAYPKNVRHA